MARKVKPKTEAEILQPRTETEIQRRILDYLLLQGIMAHKQKGVSVRGRTNQPWTRGGTNGISDITGILPGGQSLRIEVKKPGAKRQEHEALQDAYIVHAQQMGAVAFKAESVDDVIRGLKYFKVQERNLHAEDCAEYERLRK